MVYIYGGGFYEGSASLDDLSPDFLIIQDVIIVTIQYRLHVLGIIWAAVYPSWLVIYTHDDVQ